MFPVLPAAVVMGAIRSRQEAQEKKRQAAADILMQRASAGGAPTYGAAAAGVERDTGNINYAGDMLSQYMNRKSQDEMDKY